MKRTCTILFAIFVSLQSMAIYQMRNWTLPPKKVYMNFGQTPVVTNISGASGAQYKVANGAYDENNNLLFYVQDGNIMNASSTSIGSMPLSSGELKEIVIVPVPGACKKYYVIMATTLPLVTLDIWQTTVDCSSGSPVKGADVKIASLIGNGCGLAASKIISGSGSSAIRYLYAVTYNQFTRFTITNTGIASQTTLATLSGLSLGQCMPIEADLSFDGARFAWGEYSYGSPTGKVYQISTGSPYTLTTYTLPAQGGCGVNHGISGVEYDWSNNLWVSATSTCSSNKGIYKINTGTGAITNPLTGSSGYDNTELEMSIYGLNGIIIAVNNSGALGYIDPGANTISSSTLSIPVTLVSNKNTATLPPVFSLVDQIDGEDYSYFNGMPQGIAGFQINGSNPNTNCGALQQIYNCNSITLTNTSTGATSYVLEVNSIDASCNVISGGGLLTYSSGSITSLPSDLRSMPGTNGTWLATHTGKFRVKLTASNGCTTTSVYSLIEVNGPPTSVTTCFTFANNTTCSGAGVAGGSSCATAVSTCMNNPKIKADCSGGQFVGGSFDIKIDEYNSSCGFLGTVGNSVNIPLSSTADLVCLSLNDFTTTPGYFYTNTTGLRYAITLTIRNVCSTSSVTKWFADSFGGCKTDGDELTGVGDESEGDGFVRLYPNPTARNSELRFSLTNDSRVSLTITDLQGRTIAEPVKNELLVNGVHQVEVPAATFPGGVYLYNLRINENNYQGKLIKTN